LALEVVVAGVVGGIIAVLLVIWVLYLRYFVIVPPNKAIVIFGRGISGVLGGGGGGPGEGGSHAGNLKIVVGGGVFVPPWTSSYGFLPLGVLDVDFVVRSVATLDASSGPRLDIAVAAQVKIPADQAPLRTAAENLLGKSEDELKAIARSIVEGHVRGVIAQLHPDVIDRDREKCASEIQVLVATDLVALGIVVKSLVIKETRPTVTAPDAQAASNVAVAGKLTDLEAYVWQLGARLRKMEARLESAEKGIRSALGGQRPPP
jgi:flotillin